jgi:hypothetical protein
MSKELVPAETKALAKGIARVLEQSEEIMGVAMQAPDIERDPVTDRPIRPDGMSERDWNICKDAIKSTRNVPFYLHEAARTAELSRKLESGIAGDDVPRATFVMVQQINYARKDVTADRGDIIDVDVSSCQE